MKLKSLFTLAAVGMMLTACSSEEPIQNGNAPEVAGEGQNLMTLAISLPNDGTRAYDDGIAAEYAVNNVAVAIFKADGADYKCVQVDELSTSFFTSSDAAVTKTKEVAVKTDLKKTSTGNYYALAIVNYPDAKKINVGEKYNAWANATMDNVQPNGFFMTNALRTNDTDVTKKFNLEPIDLSKIYENVNIAPVGITPAATIYVERAAVKVTLATFAPTVSNATASLEGWCLDVLAQNYFTVHQYAGTYSRDIFFNEDNYRFDWATTSSTAFDLKAMADVTSANNAILYCMENAPVFGNMTQDKTTRALLKVKYTPAATSIIGTYTEGQDFYLYEGKLYTTDKLQTLTGVTLAGLTWTKGVSQIAGKDVLKYEGGICYYAVRIRHFNDDATKLPEDWKGLANDYTEAMTGRYGVVRNNWYNLTINSIKGIGTPDVPTPEGSDDPVGDNYIDYSINILKWQTHSQSEDLN